MATVKQVVTSAALSVGLAAAGHAATENPVVTAVAGAAGAAAGAAVDRDKKS